jgi:EpsI family protein
MSASAANSGAVAVRAVQLLREIKTQPATILILVAALPFILLWPTTVSLFRVWNDPARVELSHGFLTLMVTVGLLWFRRRELRRVMAIRGRADLLTGIVLLGALWLVLWRAGIQIGHQMLLPVISAATVWAVFGWRAAAGSGFALGYLYLAMPIWTILNGPLQWVSAIAVRAMLRVLDIPAHLSGTSIEISGGVFEVADGCSGLRLLLVGLAIAALYGEIIRASLLQRVMLIALAAVLSAFANWLRILIIVGAAHWFGMDHPLVGDHIWLGWVVFAGVMVVFLWVANRVPGRVPVPLPRRIPARAGTPTTFSAEATNSGTRGGVRYGSILSAVVALGLAPAWGMVQQISSDRHRATLPAPASIDGWALEPPPFDWQPTFVGADREGLVHYEKGEQHVDFFVASYVTQEQGKELVGYGNSIFGDAEPRATRAQLTRDARGSFMRSTVTGIDGRRWVYWHAYVVGEAMTGQSLRAQLQYGFASLWRMPVSSIVAARSRCHVDNCLDAHDALTGVWASAIDAAFGTSAPETAQSE